MQLSSICTVKRKSNLPPPVARNPELRFKALLHFSPLPPHGIALSLVWVLSTQGCLQLILFITSHSLNVNWLISFLVNRELLQTVQQVTGASPAHDIKT